MSKWTKLDVILDECHELRLRKSKAHTYIAIKGTNKKEANEIVTAN